MTSPRSSRTLFGTVAIAGAAVTLLAIIIVAVYSFIFVPRTPPPEVLFTDPAAAIEVERIDPALAVGALGGVAEVEVVEQAINKARPNTALTILLESPTLTDRQRVGDLLLLAERFVELGDPTRGQLSYQLAATIATLSPSLPDTIRVDTFLQVGKGLLAMGQRDLSAIYLDQALVVAGRSPYLQAAYRRRTLEQLHSIYQSLGRPEEARASMQLLGAVGEGAALPEEPLALPAGIPLAITMDIQAAEARRWAAAQVVARELVERGGRATPESQQALQDALLAEDGLKTPFLQEALAQAPQLSAQIGVLQAQVEWLSVKYRVASKSYGISLVPAWEAQVGQIRSELTKSYETLFALYADLIVALPDASQIDKATEEVLRREVLSGELGLYPNYPEEQRRQQLLAASAQLTATRPNQVIAIGVEVLGDLEIYVLVHQEALTSEN